MPCANASQSVLSCSSHWSIVCWPLLTPHTCPFDVCTQAHCCVQGTGGEEMLNIIVAAENSQ